MGFQMISTIFRRCDFFLVKEGRKTYIQFFLRTFLHLAWEEGALMKLNPAKFKFNPATTV